MMNDEFRDPFEGEQAQVGGSVEDLSAQAATEAALQAERDEIDAAASLREEHDEAQERTVPWAKNFAWDDDTSFLAGLRSIGTLLRNAQPVVDGYTQLVELGELSEEVQRREVELSITDRVLIYTALQVLGIVSGAQWREQMDGILTKLEALVEPTEDEETAIYAAETTASEAVKEILREHYAKVHPGAGVYTPEEFAEEMANPDTEDETIKRLQAEQQADLN